MKIIQSNTHHCFVCGIDNPIGLKLVFNSDGEGNVWAKKIFTKEYQSYPGIVHGGVIAAVLDEAAGRAPMQHKRPDFNLMTGKISIRYRKPVRIGETIFIEGKVISNRGRVYQCTSCLKTNTGEILAEAEATMVEPDEELSNEILPAEDEWIDLKNEEVENDR